MFNEKKIIRLLAENRKPWTAPGGLANNLFMGASPLHKQVEEAAKIPADGIKSIIDETKNTIAEVPIHNSQKSVKPTNKRRGKNQPYCQ